MEINDKKWFEDNFERLYKPLYRHLHNRIGTSQLPLLHEVDDIINDAFLIMWKKRRAFKDHPNLDALMYVVTEDSLVSRIRKLSRTVYQEWLLDDQAVDQFIQQELIQLQIAKVAEILDEEKLQMLIDYFDPSQRHQDIAKKNDLKPNTLTARVSRYIKQSRSILKIYFFNLSLFLLLKR